MKLLRPALVLNLFFIVVCGLLFPGVITAIAQTVFPNQSNGSLVVQNGKVMGSSLLGQTFTRPEYFHPRPSAAGAGYDASNSGGTNLGPTSDKLVNGVHDPKNPSGDYDGVRDLAKAYRAENGLPADATVPADAVERSASGLDPHISPRNAEIQSARVARARGLERSTVQDLIAKSTDASLGGIFGDPGVDVLKLNLALDEAAKGRPIR